MRDYRKDADRYPSRKKLRPKLPTVARWCLKCGESFRSTGPAHRLCESCNLENLQLARREGDPRLPDKPA